jgi:geranylgeranyl pyrophosphate synthase
MPVIHSLRNASKSDEDFLRESYANTKNIDGAAFIKILKKYKSDKYIKEKINKETELAISSLDSLNSSKYKEGLITLAEFCQQRAS